MAQKPHIFLYKGNWYVKSHRKAFVMVVGELPGTRSFKWACEKAKERSN